MNLRLFRPVNPAISDGFCVRAPVSPRTPLMLHVYYAGRRAARREGVWLGGGGLAHQRSQLCVLHVQQREGGEGPDLGRQRRDIGVLETEQDQAGEGAELGRQRRDPEMRSSAPDSTSTHTKKRTHQFPLS